SLAPFQKRGLEMSKTSVESIVSVGPEVPPEMSIHMKTAPPCSTVDNFPPDAIAIVGAACRLPGASSLDELWECISQGKSRLQKVPKHRVDIKGSHRASQDATWASQREFYGNFIDDITGFDHAFFGISPREAAYMDPQQRLLLECAFEAMDSSGYMRYHQRERGDPIGCFIGASYTEYLENTSSYSSSAFTATGTIRAFLSGRISYHFGWTGPSEVIDTACSASLVAVHRACQAITAGECEAALAGGVNIITGVNNYFDLGKANFLSPTGQCKPFDASADGYCRADGVGLVVLKPLRKAVLEGDHILGVIPATATNQGGIGASGITVPDGLAQKALYSRLLQKAEMGPDGVSYVEAHGTGTKVGDPVEMESVRTVFGGLQRSSPLYLGSVKGNLGHCETAAGIASLLKTLAMFRHRGIPPLGGFQCLNPNIAPLERDNIIIPTTLVPWYNDGSPRTACINSYGASGSNSAVLCSEWVVPEEQECSPSATEELPIMLSAASPESLLRYTERLAAFVGKSVSGPAPRISLRDLSYTLSQRRQHHKFRWATTVSTLEALLEELRGAKNKAFDEPKYPVEANKKVVLVFSGQSRTNINISPELLSGHHSRFAHHIRRCNEILGNLGCADIIPALTQSEPIADHTILQCGTVAVQYASAQSWIEAGIKPDAVIGHSLGELTALAVSGALSLEDVLKIVFTRAELIKTEWGGEPGTMMAVHADIATVQSLIESVGKTHCPAHDVGLEIACYNSPTSHVIVGAEEAIEVVEAVLRNDPNYREIQHQRLDVTHGFHSRFTEPLLENLARLGDGIRFNMPFIPLETSIREGEVVLDSQSSVSRYLFDHTRKPVFFSDAVRRIEKRHGGCVWLEAGIGSPIASMTRRAVANPERHSFQSVTYPAATTAELWRGGISVTYWGFIESAGSKACGKNIWLPPYSFDRHRHWLEHVDRGVGERSKAGMPTEMERVKHKKLVVYRGLHGPMAHRFQLDTTTERYTRIVRGHAVRGKPLCPASMYMESALMAIEHLSGFLSIRESNIVFENIVFYRPLGCSDRGGLGVDLVLEQRSNSTEAGKYQAWHFAVQSTHTHSEGHIRVCNSSSLHAADRGSSDCVGTKADAMAALKKDPTTERLKTATAYTLFSRVVGYSDVLRGISSIIFGEKNEALAQVQVPREGLGLGHGGSTVMDVFDAVAFDAFIQVLGLLINCGPNSPLGPVSEDAFVASSLEKMVFTGIEFGKLDRWSVYAECAAMESNSVVGQIYVYSGQGDLVCFATGIKFVRIQLAKLERMLEAVNGIQTVADSNGNADFLLDTKATETLGVFGFSTERSGINYMGDVEENRDSIVRSIISAYTGVPVEEMNPDENLRNMGLDSLAAMELADELQAKFGIKIPSDDVLLGTVGTLIGKCCPIDTAESNARSSKEHPSSAAPTDEDSAATSFSTPPLATPPDSETYKPTDQSFVHGSIINQWTRPISPATPDTTRFRIETVIYKNINSTTVIPADIYLPDQTTHRRFHSPMPIALLIHGGGHLTLSRRAIRLAQVKFLLANGVLPVSIDYRLCPQINVLDGAVADVRDACVWIQAELPNIMKARGIEADGGRYVVVGWSSGGTLAMSTAWSLKPLLGNDDQLVGPRGILGFYCPVDYAGEPVTMGSGYAPRSMLLKTIRERLPRHDVTSHAPQKNDSTNLGWLRPGDARSELVLALIKEPHGAALLFNDYDGLLPENNDSDELPERDAARAAEFSPLAHVRKGDYSTPTCVVFGDRDEIAPFDKAVEFVRELKGRGVESGILVVEGEGHIFDLGLAPGVDGWEGGVVPGYEFLLRCLES
ncbi:hypothetical protein QBC36DRAFT_197978, partial [Triangularia setosa]